MLTLTQVREIVSKCTFTPYGAQQYDFRVTESSGRWYLQAHHSTLDMQTRKGKEEFSTRKWLLSPHMTDSEIVQTVFKCCITSAEHEAREGFQYKGYSVFGPHYDVEALVDLCERRAFDARQNAAVEIAEGELA